MNPQDQEPQALPELPDLDTPCALWKLIGAWDRANRAEDIRLAALKVDAEVHRLMQTYAKAAIALATQEPQRAEPADIATERDMIEGNTQFHQDTYARPKPTGCYCEALLAGTLCNHCKDKSNA